MIVTDQTGNTIELSGVPQRIISLVPSQTELLYDLGLGEQVVGITKFCVHPAQWFRSKTRIGGTKTVNLELIRALQPDLVIANKEENVREQIEAIMQIAPVYISDIYNLADALDMINALGMLTQTTAKACPMIAEINTGFNKLTQRTQANPAMNSAGTTPIKNGLSYLEKPVHGCRPEHVYQPPFASLRLTKPLCRSTPVSRNHHHSISGTRL